MVNHKIVVRIRARGLSFCSMNQRTVYQSPLLTRYASREMLHLFSDDFKFTTWRKLWIALAEAERQLGIQISGTQLEELKKYQDKINYQAAERLEKETRHDVMAHVKAYGLQCKKAARIIHLGATSAFVGDNTDLIQLREACALILLRLAVVIRTLSEFARKYASTAALGYTHFQAAQPVTVGKRACLWTQDLLMDLRELENFRNGLKFLGAKGATGTQASFLNLFRGNSQKVKRLDALITRRMGFHESFPVSGQTYPRKVDSQILSILGRIAQSCHKFSSDVRLLQHLKEVEEPFGKGQIGSSAMAYKRNPMRSERMASLARFVMALGAGCDFTAATQWFERTLDDSANKRISVPEAFLAMDAILLIYQNIASGLVVNLPVIRRRLAEELPFMATENILMEAVKRGGDRQKLHERMRTLSMEAREKQIRGQSTDLLQKISSHPEFRLSRAEIRSLADPRKFTGLAKDQTLAFVRGHALPAIRKYLLKQPASEDLKV